METIDLLWIIPLCVCAGFLLAALFSANGR